MKRIFGLVLLLAAALTAHAGNTNPTGSNQVGPSGPSGPSGPTGASGPAGATGANGLSQTAPTWMQNPAGGFETDPNGNVSLQGHHRYASTFTIPVGDTLTITRDTSYPDGFGPAGALWVEAPTCVIAGTIAGGSLIIGNGATGDAWLGATGGGGGGDAAVNAGLQAGDSCSWTVPVVSGVNLPVPPPTSYCAADGLIAQSVGGLGGAVATVGGDGNAMTPASKEFLYSLGYTLFQGLGFLDIGGSGGGSNFGQLQFLAKGGASLFLNCMTMDYRSTAVTTLTGENGSAGEATKGGYGGAAGGIAWFAAHTYTHSPASTGTINLAGGVGGAGGVGAGNGGAGHVGDKEVFTY